MAEAPWRDPAWLAEATAWVEREVAAAGLAVTGPVEQPHVYWWATALRVPTSGGVLWCKAAQPDGAYEARLTPLLAAGWPDVTVEVVATDPDRGLMLTRDAGVRLRDAEDGPALDRWADLLPRYAELQLALAPRRAELLGLGVPDHGLAALPGQAAAALDDPDAVLLDPPDGLTEEQRAELRRRLPELGEQCARLAALGVPETLQHDDLHDGNVFVRDDRPVFVDWGDACVSHPFHTLAVTLRALSHRYALPPGGPELTRLRDAYLEPFTAVADRAAVADAADLARRTGSVQRAVSWHRVARAMPPEVRGEYVDAVPYGLRLYLLDPPYGTWDDGTF